MPLVLIFPADLWESLEYWYRKPKDSYEYVIWKINDNKESIDALVKFW
jgi:hypothetical protein